MPITRAAPKEAVAASSSSKGRRAGAAAAAAAAAAAVATAALPAAGRPQRLLPRGLPAVAERLDGARGHAPSPHLYLFVCPGLLRALQHPDVVQVRGLQRQPESHDGDLRRPRNQLLQLRRHLADVEQLADAGHGGGAVHRPALRLLPELQRRFLHQERRRQLLQQRQLIARGRAHLHVLVRPGSDDDLHVPADQDRHNLSELLRDGPADAAAAAAASISTCAAREMAVAASTASAAAATAAALPPAWPSLTSASASASSCASAAIATAFSASAASVSAGALLPPLRLLLLSVSLPPPRSVSSLSSSAGSGSGHSSLGRLFGGWMLHLPPLPPCLKPRTQYGLRSHWPTAAGLPS
mmetsp:Transcript_14888/g.49450  ORF Transcript_14888/g.49450 Transcript_14888/m.49450 type:complete len:355 (+) Transcript_14888:741-1805(+)